MKVLWIVNIMLPEIAKVNKTEATPFGGWLVSVSEDLAKQENLNLKIIYPYKDKQKGNVIEKYQFESFFNKNEINNIIDEFEPDLVHIFGTEFKHSYEAIECLKEKNLLDNTLISIQGLVSMCAEHYYAALPYNICKKYSFRDFIKRDNIIKQKQKFANRGIFEKKVLNNAKNILGRTEWDYACVKKINPQLKYYFCNESLREEFYIHQWDIGKIERHSIFVSQCGYPLKGFHLMLNAFKDIIQIYPDAKLYVAGKSPFVKGFQRIRQSYYSIYLKKLIYKYNIRNNVVFLDYLNAEQMKERFLKSHVFALTSSIENSPNSLGEAMLLGVPCVASGVGGVDTILEHKKEGFIYQFDAPYMLAHYIIKIFKDDDLALRLSENAQEKAKKTHDRKKNLNTLLEIYKKIGNNKGEI